MYVWQYVATSIALTVSVIAKSLAVYPNFYSAMLAISDNSATLCVIVNQILCFLWLASRLVIWMIFGELRLAEIEFIYQKIWFLAIEGVFIAGSLSTRKPLYDFGLLITLIGTLLVFHWILQKRASVFFRMMDQPTKLQFIRIYLFTAVLIYVNLKLCMYGWRQLLLGNKMVTLLTPHFVDLLQISIRSMCALCTDFYEAYIGDIEDDEQWEAKDKIMLAIDFVLEFGSLFIYGVICYALNKVPLHLVLGIVTRGHKLYSVMCDANRMFTATSKIDSFVSSPEPEDIARDNCCVICREEMLLDAPQDRMKPRKMNCGHVIHLACLKSWLGRSPNCPTCRQPVNGATSAFISQPSTNLPPGLAAVAPAQPAQDEARPDREHEAGGPTRPGSAASTTGTGGGSRGMAASRPGSPENPPLDTSTWKRFPTRDTSTGPEFQVGNTWYQFTVL